MVICTNYWTKWQNNYKNRQKSNSKTKSKSPTFLDNTSITCPAGCANLNSHSAIIARNKLEFLAQQE